MSKNYNLSFISNDDLYSHVEEAVGRYRFNIDLKEFNKNIVDPIKLTFDSKVYSKDIENVIESEVIRQMDKSNSNTLGYFPQNIFKYIHHKDTVTSDWIVPQRGFDIVDEKNKVYVEMKNKHNTMNSSSSQKTYMRMQSQIMQDPTSRCFLVEVIAKHSQDIEWRVSLDGVATRHPNIRRVL